MSSLTVYSLFICVLIAFHCIADEYKRVNIGSMTRNPELKAIGVICVLHDGTVKPMCTGWLDRVGLLHTNAHCFKPLGTFANHDVTPHYLPKYLAQSTVRPVQLQNWINKQRAINIAEYIWIPADRWLSLVSFGKKKKFKEPRKVPVQDAIQNGLRFDRVYLPSKWLNFINDYVAAWEDKFEELNPPQQGPQLKASLSSSSTSSSISTGSTASSGSTVSSSSGSTTSSGSTVSSGSSTSSSSSWFEGGIQPKVSAPNQLTQLQDSDILSEGTRRRLLTPITLIHRKAIFNQLYNDAFKQLDQAIVKLLPNTGVDLGDYHGFYIHPFRDKKAYIKDKQPLPRVMTAGFPSYYHGRYVIGESILPRDKPDEQWTDAFPFIYFDFKSGGGASGSPLWVYYKTLAQRPVIYPQAIGLLRATQNYNVKPGTLRSQSKLVVGTQRAKTLLHSGGNKEEAKHFTHMVGNDIEFIKFQSNALEFMLRVYNNENINLRDAFSPNWPTIPPPTDGSTLMFFTFIAINPDPAYTPTATRKCNEIGSSNDDCLAENNGNVICITEQEHTQDALTQCQRYGRVLADIAMYHCRDKLDTSLHKMVTIACKPNAQGSNAMIEYYYDIVGGKYDEYEYNYFSVYNMIIILEIVIIGISILVAMVMLVIFCLIIAYIAGFDPKNWCEYG